MYHLVCVTCEVEQVIQEYDEADRQFVEHSREGHRVAMVNLDQGSA